MEPESFLSCYFLRVFFCLNVLCYFASILSTFMPFYFFQLFISFHSLQLLSGFIMNLFTSTVKHFGTTPVVLKCAVQIKLTCG